MSTIRDPAASRAARRAFAIVAALAVLPLVGSACSPTPAATDQVPSSDEQKQKAQAGGSDKPGSGDASGSSGQSAADQASKLSDRELVERRMALCRQRPETCVQKGGKGEKDDAAKSGGAATQ